MKLFKLPSREFKSYMLPGRLTDILASIQVLALQKDRHRSENGIEKDLQGKPSSAKTWKEIAQEHPEFFRVDNEREHNLSLISRHVLPPNEAGLYVMPPEYFTQILRTAIEIYDRQVKLSERWTYLLPFWGIVIAAILGFIANVLINVFFPN